MLGWFFANYYNAINVTNVENPFAWDVLVNGNIEVSSPQDHIKEKDIKVYGSEVILKIQNASWSKFADTNSMDPLIDKGANGIEIKPSRPSQVKEGDVIAYRSSLTNNVIIHRVVSTGKDKLGWYAKTKGDNNPGVDPGKVRFDDIQGILVAVVY